MGRDIVEKARRIIQSNRYMTLATFDGATPWAAPVAYVIDDQFSFYWGSLPDTRHSRDVKATGLAAIAVFDSTASYDDVDGIQASGTAGVIERPDEAATVRDLYVARYPMHRDVQVSDLTGAGRFRLYRFRPTAMFKLDTSTTDGDRRLEVDLVSLVAG
jgi:uncharacterized protein YhbP (UPF0306 family)